MFYQYEVCENYISIPEGCELRLTQDQVRRRKHAIKKIEGTENSYLVTLRTGFKKGEVFEASVRLENQGVIQHYPSILADDEREMIENEVIEAEQLEEESDIPAPPEKRKVGRPRKSFLTPKKREY